MTAISKPMVDSSRKTADSAEPPSISYLISCYPAVSHTFVLREILQLRDSGLRIHTASINSPEESSDGFSDREKVEVRNTFYVKQRAIIRILGDHLRSLARRPWHYLVGVGLTLRLAGLDIGYLPHYISYFMEAVVIGEWMRRSKQHHLHVHFANAGATVALIVSRMYPIRYSITVHGSDEFYGVAFYRLREKIEGASFVCCISQFCRSQLMRIISPDQWQKLEVCPLGVDPNHFRPAKRRTENTFNVCSVGRLVLGKGHVTLFEVLAKLVQQGKQIHLDLVGDGPDRKVLENVAIRYGIAPNVTFHGSVNGNRVYEILQSADVFVLPSFAEGVPVSLMEAMAMEIPCVSTIVGGIPELISTGVDGILVPPSDVELLAAAVEMLIENPEYRSRVGRAGREKIIQRYHLETNVAKLVRVFWDRAGIASEPVSRDKLRNHDKPC